MIQEIYKISKKKSNHAAVSLFHNSPRRKELIFIEQEDTYMKRNMKQWKEDLIAARAKKAMPVFSFPGGR